MHDLSPDDFTDRYRAEGFVLLGGAVGEDVLSDLEVEAERHLGARTRRGGARNLLHRSPRFRLEGDEGVCAEVARRILGPEARATKLTLFDKSPAANWLIRWHQDLTIAVHERREVGGFTAWSEKEGVAHVRARVAVLEKIVAVRLHLDDTPASDGALRVLPGSHRLGRLERPEIGRLCESGGEAVCEALRGDLLVMSPLLLHASSKATRPARRRVLHFEFSASPLPGGLEWA